MDPADLSALATAYGPPGVVIGVLLGAVRALYLRVIDLQDKRIEDWRSQSAQLHDSVRMLDRTRDVLEGRRDA